MSTRNLMITREGFNQSISLGDVFLYQDTPYIIIKILSMKRMTSLLSIKLKYEVVAQQIDSPNDSALADNTDFTNVYTVDDLEDIMIDDDKEFPKYGSIPKRKYLQVDTGIDESEGVTSATPIINSIKRIYFHGTELVVDFTCGPVLEWSRSDVSKAIIKARMKKFRVLDGGKNAKKTNG